jgi:KRAB domain-containing zinc finger protein
LNRHMFFIHGEPNNVRVHLCTTCGLKCSSPMRLQVHERIHTGERPFFCTACGKTFMSQINLNRHTQALHVQKSHMCSTCGKIFTCVAYLKRHQRSHTNSALPPVKCEYCRRQFTLQASLMRHVRQFHNIDGIYPRKKQKHTCHVCGKSVARLDSHMKLHSEQRKYRCSSCGEAFVWHKQLKRHIDKEHGEDS